MTLTRSTSAKPRKPLKTRSAMNQISEKRRAEFAAAGIDNPYSSFLPASAKSSIVEPKAARRKPALPQPQMVKLKARSGGFCEIRVSGCQNFAVDPAHRKGSKAGGRHGEAEVLHAQLSNVLHACRHCHDWCHANSEAAKAESAGWMVDENVNPAQRPVKYRGEMSWLLDDGRVVPYEELAA